MRRRSSLLRHIAVTAGSDSTALDSPPLRGHYGLEHHRRFEPMPGALMKVRFRMGWSDKLASCTISSGMKVVAVSVLSDRSPFAALHLGI